MVKLALPLMAGPIPTADWVYAVRLSTGSAALPGGTGSTPPCGGHLYCRTARTNAATGDDQRRPATVTRHTSRSTTGSVTGRPTTPAMVLENSGRKQIPIPAATMVR